jgi:hypothetical protein
MAIDRFRQFREDLDSAASDSENTVLRRRWQDTVDDYDLALRVRLAG